MGSFSTEFVNIISSKYNISLHKTEDGVSESFQADNETQVFNTSNSGSFTWEDAVKHLSKADKKSAKIHKKIDKYRDKIDLLKQKLAETSELSKQEKLQKKIDKLEQKIAKQNSKIETVSEDSSQSAIDQTDQDVTDLQGSEILEEVEDQSDAGGDEIVEKKVPTSEGMIAAGTDASGKSDTKKNENKQNVTGNKQKNKTNSKEKTNEKPSFGANFVKYQKEYLDARCPGWNNGEYSGNTDFLEQTAFLGSVTAVARATWDALTGS